MPFGQAAATAAADPTWAGCACSGAGRQGLLCLLCFCFCGLISANKVRHRPLTNRKLGQDWGNKETCKGTAHDRDRDRTRGRAKAKQGRGRGKGKSKGTGNSGKREGALGYMVHVQATGGWPAQGWQPRRTPTAGLAPGPALAACKVASGAEDRGAGGGMAPL